MRALVRAAMLGVLFGALYVASGCTAVLGIEEATLETTAAPSQAVCNASQGTQLAKCSPVPDVQNACENCIKTKCAGTPSASIETPAYRIALANYRSCQRAECTDDGSCASCLSADPSAACVGGCAKECQTAEVLSWCDAYCTCMGQTCPSPTYRTKDGQMVATGATADATCQTKCAAEETWRVNCLLTHCELARTNGQGHCRHADDSDHACSSTPPPATTCTDHHKAQLGYPCTADGGCCSGNCKDKATSGTCSL